MLVRHSMCSLQSCKEVLSKCLIKFKAPARLLAEAMQEQTCHLQQCTLLQIKIRGPAWPFTEAMEEQSRQSLLVQRLEHSVLWLTRTCDSEQGTKAQCLMHIRTWLAGGLSAFPAEYLGTRCNNGAFIILHLHDAYYSIHAVHCSQPSAVTHGIPRAILKACWCLVHRPVLLTLTHVHIVCQGIIIHATS